MIVDKSTFGRVYHLPTQLSKKKSTGHRPRFHGTDERSLIMGFYGKNTFFPSFIKI